MLDADNGSCVMQGSNIMLTGIVFQLGTYRLSVRVFPRLMINLVAMVIFSALMTEYLVRYALGRPIRRGSSGTTISIQAEDTPTLDRGMKMLLGGVALSTLFLLIRLVLILPLLCVLLIHAICPELCTGRSNWPLDGMDL